MGAFSVGAGAGDTGPGLEGPGPDPTDKGAGVSPLPGCVRPCDSLGGLCLAIDGGGGSGFAGEAAAPAGCIFPVEPPCPSCVFCAVTAAFLAFLLDGVRGSDGFATCAVAATAFFLASSFFNEAPLTPASL